MADFDLGGGLPSGVCYVEIGAPRTGLWCVCCALPSLIEVPLTTLTERGVTAGGSYLTVCTEHGLGDR